MAIGRLSGCIREQTGGLLYTEQKFVPFLGHVVKATLSVVIFPFEKCCSQNPTQCYAQGQVYCSHQFPKGRITLRRKGSPRCLTCRINPSCQTPHLSKDRRLINLVSSLCIFDTKPSAQYQKHTDNKECPMLERSNPKQIRGGTCVIFHCVL